MKNTLKLNHADRTIVMDKTFAKFALDTRTDEYKHLQEVRRDYPNYIVIQRQIHRNTDKKTYHGLTYKYMEDYIKSHGTKEERETNLADFNEKVLISKCHGKAYRYPVIKQWFLDLYPDIRDFGLPKEDSSEEKEPSSNIVELDTTQETSAEELPKGA